MKFKDSCPSPPSTKTNEQILNEAPTGTVFTYTTGSIVGVYQKLITKIVCLGCLGLKSASCTLCCTDDAIYTASSFNSGVITLKPEATLCLDGCK